MSQQFFKRGSLLNPFFCHYSYVFQEEQGENGTPHLQGYLHYKEAVALSTIKAWNPRLHLEPTRSVVQSVAYCSDPAKRHGAIWTLGYAVPDQPRLFIIDEGDLYTWQRDLVASLALPADDRSIIWYQDRLGGSGKTAMARYLLAALGRKCLYLSGGAAKDILYQVVKMKEDPSVILFNLARTAEGKVSYQAIETVKDGLVQSGKYEGGFRMFPPPHVIIFANWPPDFTALSHDRWILRELDNNRIV